MLELRSLQHIPNCELAATSFPPISDFVLPYSVRRWHRCSAIFGPLSASRSFSQTPDIMGLTLPKPVLPFYNSSHTYVLIRSFIRSLNSSDTSGAYNSRTCPWDLVSCPTYPPMICRVAHFTTGHRRVPIDGSTESQDKEVRGLPASSPSFLSDALLVQVAPSRISDIHPHCPHITVHILGKDVHGDYLPRQLMPLVFVHSSVERDRLSSL